MDTYEYIPIDQPGVGDTYILHADVEQRPDGSWSAWAKELPGYGARGYTREQALDALREVARAYIRMRLEHGGIPHGIETIGEPIVAVTL